MILFLMSIGRKIREKRRELGFSQESLAQKLNVTQRTIVRWEQDEALPRPDSLNKLADIFGITIKYFFDIEDNSSLVEELGIPFDVLESVKNPKMQEIVRALRPIIEDD